MLCFRFFRNELVLPGDVGMKCCHFREFGAVCGSKPNLSIGSSWRRKGVFCETNRSCRWPAPPRMKETLAGQTGKPLPLVAARSAVVLCRRIFQCKSFIVADALA